jgi:hypothetical protein
MSMDNRDRLKIPQNECSIDKVERAAGRDQVDGCASDSVKHLVLDSQVSQDAFDGDRNSLDKP